MSALPFDAKRPDEVEVFAFDFRRMLATGETIVTKSVKAVLADDATEASVAGMVTGPATESGGVVSQLVAGGTDGVTYTLLCTVTTSPSGQTLVAQRDLPIVRDQT